MARVYLICGAGNPRYAPLSEEFLKVEGMLDRCQIARDTVTLVLDKGSAALANTVELQEAGVGWISALPWNQAARKRGLERSSL